MKFSALLSIYYKESPDNFNRCMESIWDDQEIRPDEIVLVQDGVLTPDLDQVIARWKQRLGERLKLVAVEHNVGLGDALNIGLDHCVYDIVARMDTDDISTPDRFERQLKILSRQDIGICGGWVGEFSTDETEISSIRKLPENHADILAFAKRRNPLNHPTVMFRKQAVLDAGGYQKMMWFEDYFLWVRMIQNEVQFYNIPDILVYMQAGDSMLQRRRHAKYAVQEFKLQSCLYRMGFISFFQFATNVAIRFTVRLLPKPLLHVTYRVLRMKP